MASWQKDQPKKTFFLKQSFDQARQLRVSRVLALNLNPFGYLILFLENRD